MERDYLIAGLRVRMDTFGRTEEQAAPYEIEKAGEPDIVIESVGWYIKEVQPDLDEETCEYIATGASFFRQLLKFDAMFIHSSAVVKDGYAYLFSAPCGTGKSTHTALWQAAFGAENAQILNDDKPTVRLENGRWYAYGTPWSGKTSLNINMRVPLGGVCLLSRGETNEIAPYGGAKATLELLEQTSRTGGAAYRGKLLELMDHLITNVPVWKLKCNPTTDAAIVSHKAMAEEAKKRFG
ncbi:MAG: hypothetical protein E7447_04750 [Ruminococcaceae bacterium]|nr:hypothetical protein [Oscillospiraceae bacterium]